MSKYSEKEEEDVSIFYDFIQSLELIIEDTEWAQAGIAENIDMHCTWSVEYFPKYFNRDYDADGRYNERLKIFSDKC